jgi:hypothetical protein
MNTKQRCTVNVASGMNNAHGKLLKSFMLRPTNGVIQNSTEVNYEPITGLRYDILRRDVPRNVGVA